MTTKYEVQNTTRLPLNFIQAICFKRVLTGQQKTEEVVGLFKNTSWNIANNHNVALNSFFVLDLAPRPFRFCD